MGREVLTDQNLIDDVLGRAEIIYLAVCDDNGPHCVPVNFASQGRCIYLHSGVKGRKMDALRQDGRVSFSTCVDLKLISADQACDHGYCFKSVVGAGRATVLEDESDRRHALGVITRKYAGQDLPVDEKTLRCTVVARIDIQTLTVRVA